MSCNSVFQVAVPYEFHRFIIGQKGMGVREMMNCYDVNIRVPSQEAKSDLVIISGVPSNVEAAKVTQQLTLTHNILHYLSICIFLFQGWPG